MTNEKFTEQVTTLAKFLQTYCTDKHALEPKREINLELTYKSENLNDSVRTQLCAECEQLFSTLTSGFWPVRTISNRAAVSARIHATKSPDGRRWQR